MSSPITSDELNQTLVTRGLPASPGLVTGKIALSAEEAIERSQAGEEIILVRHQTLAEDVPAIQLAQGVMTTLGGLTCHAAIVARDLKKPCVVGCTSLRLSETTLEVGLGDAEIRLGREDRIQLDANTGEVFWLKESVDEPSSA